MANRTHAAIVARSPSVLTPGFAASAARGITAEALRPLDSFERRHNSASKADEAAMAQYVGFESMDALVDATVPADIRRHDGMQMGEWTQPLSESEYLSMFKAMASKNKVLKSLSLIHI